MDLDIWLNYFDRVLALGDLDTVFAAPVAFLSD